MRLNQYVADVKPSATMALNQKAKAMAKEGRSIINLTVGEPDFPTPKNIAQAGIHAIEQGETHYTAASGIPELREAVQKWAQIEYGRKYNLSQVLITSGAKQALFNLCFSTLNPGDEVIVIAPYWVSYADMASMMGAHPIVVKAEEKNGFVPKIEDVQKVVTAKTRLLFLNSPSNPTGALYDEAFIAAVAKLAQKWPELLVVTDDIYAKLIYDGQKFLSIGMLTHMPSDQLLIISGVSKTYSMTGWRIGFALGPKAIISAMSTVQSQSTSNPSSISQWAALEAITGEQKSVIAMQRAFKERRDFIWEKIDQIPQVSCVKPQGAFYLFPNIQSYLKSKNSKKVEIKTDIDLASFLLENWEVAVVPGTAFGSPGFLRLSFGTSKENLIEGIIRMKKAFQNLQSLVE